MLRLCAFVGLILLLTACEGNMSERQERAARFIEKIIVTLRGGYGQATKHLSGAVQTIEATATTLEERFNDVKDGAEKVTGAVTQIKEGVEEMKGAIGNGE